MMHLFEGPVNGHITKDRRRKKSQDPAGIEPTTSVTRCALNRCAATAAQQSTSSYWVPSFGGDKNVAELSLLPLRL